MPPVPVTLAESLPAATVPRSMPLAAVPDSVPAENRPPAFAIEPDGAASVSGPAVSMNRSVSEILPPSLPAEKFTSLPSVLTRPLMSLVMPPVPSVPASTLATWPATTSPFSSMSSPALTVTSPTFRLVVVSVPRMVASPAVVMTILFSAEFVTAVSSALMSIDAARVKRPPVVMATRDTAVMPAVAASVSSAAPAGFAPVMKKSRPAVMSIEPVVDAALRAVTRPESVTSRPASMTREPSAWSESPLKAATATDG